MKNNPETFHIKTFGCAMNIADSERCRAILESYGLSQVQDINEADIVVFNTCSVRQKAEDRVYGLKPFFEEFENTGKHPITILTGCMARRRFNKEDVKRNTTTQKKKSTREKQIKLQAPWLDIVVEIQEFPEVYKRINKVLKDKNIEQLKIRSTKPFLEVKRRAERNISAGITISHGCDHLCTYCIVPYARGREENRDSKSIIKETYEAVQNGSKDIILLGQTVNRWINPDYKSEYISSNRLYSRIDKINKTPLAISLDNKEYASEIVPKDFLQLLQVIDSIEGNYWLSFISSHPNYYTKELIDFIARSVKNGGHLKPFIHLALQSGNDEILRKMRRNHTIEEFKEKIRYMKTVIPEVSITTDIIVGFPGETDAQFNDTLEVCSELKFDQIYISEYSEREGTGASFMNDDIKHETKTHRKNLINEVLKSTALQNNQRLINKETSVLVHKKVTNGTYQARTKHNKLIRIKSKVPVEIGNIYKAEITKATPWALAGIIK